MRLELYPFRFRDPLTGKWVRSRFTRNLEAAFRRIWRDCCGRCIAARPDATASS